MKRYSRKREAILNVLRSTEEHPSAEWVYEQLKGEMPELSLATVYRNIAEFKKAGSVLSVGVVQDKERFDANTLPHAHLICRNCGAVLDAEIINGEAVAQAVHTPEGAEVQRCDITFHGICRECLKSQSREETA